ncbi:trypsin 5G1-like [Arctopsyche grandis]|uniref:trypsin 5G1-like n=1 Tax=Arctopsyche grandis TaxID=121162 RepID=UPI00406D6C3A
MMTVLGWGFTKEKGSPSEHLRSVGLPVFPHEECKKIYANVLNVTSEMICLGFTDGGQDACIVDSGGPLVKNGTVFGLVSWGWGCGRSRHPGVYTDLSTPHLLAWIKTVIQYKIELKN